MIATGANNIKLLFSTIFITAFSVFATTMNGVNETEAAERKSSTTAKDIHPIADDTSFIVKAIKFHQQQVMLADIADKKLTDTSLKRIVSQIRVDHQASLGELFKLYKTGNNQAASKAEKNWNDSLIADRTNDLSKEEEKVSDMNGSNFKNRWLNIMLKEYDHIIPEFEEALEGSMNEKVRKATTTALSKIKENRQELNDWKSGGNAKK